MLGFWTQVTNSKICVDYDVILKWHPPFEDYDVTLTKKRSFSATACNRNLKLVSNDAKGSTSYLLPIHYLRPSATKNELLTKNRILVIFTCFSRFVYNVIW